MNKNILKKFAIESRNDLMNKMKHKIATFYVNENFNKEQKGDLYILSNENHILNLTHEEYKKRELLIKRINDVSIDQVIEEAAYTWFNRIIAIRYMEIHDYLPLTKDNQSLGIRVLSSKDNKPDPEILKFTNLTNPDLDIEFKKEKYIELKGENEKFKYILSLICKKLTKVIPQVFDGITNYIDILMPDNLLNDTGFVTKVINEIPEDNFNQVEIIGWLYQYYNQTEKDRVISAKKAYNKNEIPYATQLFTPDWIVKYMVENSLGRYWIEHSDDDSITNHWKYFIKDNIEKTNSKLNPTEITFIDPCSGSGHILVYAFAVFYQIYLQAGYNKKDIPELIIKNNLYGLDIDDRAGQLSILSVLLKAREYDRDIFNKDIIQNLHIMSIQESNNIPQNIIDNISNNALREQAKYLIYNFQNAKEIGSLLVLEAKDYSQLENNIHDDTTIFGIKLRDKLLPIIKVAKILSNKYSVVVTNPPYLSIKNMNERLKKYISNYYKDGKADLCTAFMEFNNVKDNGYFAMINQQAWMFLSSFEKIREKILKNFQINSMLHLGMGTFGIDFGTTSFCLKKTQEEKKGIYFRLVDYKTSEDKEKAFLKIKKNSLLPKMFSVSKEKFNKILGHPIAYWLSKNAEKVFEKAQLINDIGVTKTGMTTGNNAIFLRYWYEVEFKKIKFNARDAKDIGNLKWVPYAKGGGYRKWKGIDEYVVNWWNDGYEIKNFTKNDRKASSVRSEKMYFKKCITWSSVTSALFSTRILNNGYIYDSGGSVLFLKDEKKLSYIQGILASKISQYFLNIYNSTLNYQPGDVARIPIIFDDERYNKIIKFVDECCAISSSDWDSFETSWGFLRHPLIEYKSGSGYEKSIDNWNYRIKDAYNSWELNCNHKFELLKENEEELNKIFIDIYKLQDALTPEEDDKDVTIRKADQVREIKSLISYAVGCMFGRYSLDKEGLIYAGGDFDKIYKKNKKVDGGFAGASQSNYKVLNDNGKEIDLSFEVDNDNVIPITDEPYFKDDIVERFKEFIKVAYGKETLNENLDFIAETLGKKGTETSEDTIRRYFVNDFFKDHVKTYKKRAIYWLFDSGKKNGFKALIYMHRYNENLVPKIRLDYLYRMQTTYEHLLSDINYKLTTDLSVSEKKEIQKKKIELNAKLQELKEYYEKIAHIANQRIKIDLDDGVKVNYKKFEDVLAKIK